MNWKPPVWLSVGFLMAVCIGVLLFITNAAPAKPVTNLPAIIPVNVTMDFVSGTEYKPGQAGQVIVEARYPNGTSAITTNSSNNTWLWDFQNDGVIDSNTQNPIFSFPAGVYTVNLTINGISGVKSNYIQAFSTFDNLYDLNGNCAATYGSSLASTGISFTSAFSAPGSPGGSANLTPGSGRCQLSIGGPTLAVDYTTSIWLYPTQDLGSGGAIWQREFATNGSALSIISVGSNRTIEVIASSNATFSLFYTWGVGNFSNRWINIVWVHNGTNMYMYADGILVNSTSGYSLTGDAAPLDVIGGTAFSPNTVPAYVDEVRTSNYAWSALQVYNMYAMTNYPITSVNFTANTTSGAAPLSVQFTDTSSISPSNGSSTACTANVWYPNKIIFISNQTMMYEPLSGNAYINFTIPSIDGVFEYQSTCLINSNDIIASHSFHVTKPHITAVTTK